ncbi:hypothetical protein [Streptomyces marincola]|uniref:hypothetical protein n=1 Tax=Streptomyces marincola TaxID=2878388 RepID=UPI001CF21BA3|nr:hypothetical protein [Streptomyces marincola]UCM91628.1 hypothetical protein LC193_28780 [Streptomyces marincola]
MILAMLQMGETRTCRRTGGVARYGRWRAVGALGFAAIFLHSCIKLVLTAATGFSATEVPRCWPSSASA